MCGRVSLLARSHEVIASQFGATISEEARADWRPRYNACPGDRHPVLVADGAARHVSLMTWGRANSTGQFTINARADNLRRWGMWRGMLETRCVVLMDGFYEWAGKGRPVWLHRGGPVLPTAGLWTAVEGVRRFVVVTVAPNAEVAEVHDRMPAILHDEDIELWLSGGASEALPLLQPLPDGALQAKDVDAAISYIDADGVERHKPRRQLELF